MYIFFGSEVLLLRIYTVDVFAEVHNAACRKIFNEALF